jgi:hypothetical protein
MSSNQVSLDTPSDCHSDNSTLIDSDRSSVCININNINILHHNHHPSDCDSSEFSDSENSNPGDECSTHDNYFALDNSQLPAYDSVPDISCIDDKGLSSDNDSVDLSSDSETVSNHSLSDTPAPPSIPAHPGFPCTLTRSESQLSLDQWRSDMTIWLAEDSNFEPFLSGCIWTRKSASRPFRGLIGDPPPGNSAEIKVLALNAMLSRIATLCPIISPRALNDHSTSLANVWQTIYLHFSCKP